MSFIRPRVRAVLFHWRAAIVGAGLVLVGIYLVATGLTAQRFIGFGVIGLGLVIVWDGIRRARFPAPGGGAGVVEVDERRITYFGPEGGGSVSIDGLLSVTIVTTDMGPFASDLFWQFQDTADQQLIVPSNAEGAEALFDALSALPGVNYGAVIAASGSTKPQSFDIWRRSPRRLH